MRNRNLPLLNHLLSLPPEAGLDLDPVTEDGTGCLEYGVYGGFVEGCEAYRRKAVEEGVWERVRGRRNKYGCNAALWAGLGKWCVGGGGEVERVWSWVFDNLGEREVMARNGNGHTVMHKLAQRGAGEAAKVVGRWWKGGWGRDNDGLMPSDLARAEGWKEGEIWFREEEERRGCV